MRWRLEGVDASADVLYFRDVSNAADVREKLLQGELECAILDPTAIVDVFQVLVAAYAAAQRDRIGKLSTRTLHSEVVFSLAATKSISRAFRTFGLRDSLERMVVVVIVPSPHGKAVDVAAQPAAHLQDIRQAIHGTEVDDVEQAILQSGDHERVRELYSVSSLELEAGSLLDAVVTRVAARLHT